MTHFKPFIQQLIELRNIGSDLGAAVKNFKDAVKNENTPKNRASTRKTAKTRARK